MAIEDENVAVLKKAYERWADRKGEDCGCWTAIMADDASLESLADGAPEMAFTARRRGKDQILAYLEELTREWQMLSYEISEYIAQGDRVVAVGRCAWRNKNTGKVADTPKVDLWRLRDGQVVEFAEFYDTAQVFSAARF
jgi:ketosteroid isomerase-like protein